MALMLGHIWPYEMKALPYSQNIFAFEFFKFSLQHHCLYKEQTQKLHNDHLEHGKGRLYSWYEVTSVDLWQSILQEEVFSLVHSLMITHKRSGYIHLNKTTVFWRHFKLVALLENQWDIDFFKIENGGNYLSKSFHGFCKFE